MPATTFSLSKSASERVSLRKLIWVGSLALAISIAANQIIRLIALNVFNASPQFPPLGVGQINFFTVLGVVGATIVFAILAKFSSHPIAWYRRIAIGALFFSFIPDAGLLGPNPLPGTSLHSVGALVIMHIVTAAIVISLLTTQTREK